MERATTNAALATVVRVEGSSYRRTGARMLVMDNGIWAGGISGGCLEGDALKRARLAIAKSAASIVTYDTTDDDAYQVGVGLGCNGIIDVLFTPLKFDDINNPVEILKDCLAAGRQTHVFITVMRTTGGWQNVVPGLCINYSNRESLHVFEEGSVAKQLSVAITSQIENNKSAHHSFTTASGWQLEIFIEVLPPEISVILMGSQYDVYPLARLIKEIGWRVTVVADVQKLQAGINQIADELIAPAGFAAFVADEYTAIILMAHDYKTDKNNLLKALVTAAPYIGILGPRNRFKKMLDELAEEGKQLSTENLHRIHAPVGLDIGALTPEEIALSVAAEVRACISKRDGGELRFRGDNIHDRG